MPFLAIFSSLWSSPVVRWGLAVLIGYLALQWYVHGKVAEERAIAQATIDKMKSDQVEYDKAVKVHVDKYAAETDKAKTDLAEAMKGIEERKDKIVTIIKEVPKYVTVKADARSVASNAFPAGWLYLYNLPLRTEVPAVAGSPPGDVDAATGVRASTVIRVAARNNAECVARGEEIGKWKEWYATSKARYEEFFKNLPPPVPIPDTPDDIKRKREILGLGISNPFRQ